MNIRVLAKTLSDQKMSKTRERTCSPSRLPGRWLTGPVGGWGRLCLISLSIDKVWMLKGVCQSSFALRNNSKLTKSHVRRPVSRRTSGCAPVIMGLGFAIASSDGHHPSVIAHFTVAACFACGCMPSCAHHSVSRCMSNCAQSGMSLSYISPSPIFSGSRIV